MRHNVALPYSLGFRCRTYLRHTCDTCDTPATSSSFRLPHRVTLYCLIPLGFGVAPTCDTLYVLQAFVCRFAPSG